MIESETQETNTGTGKRWTVVYRRKGHADQGKPNYQVRSQIEKVRVK